MIRTILGKSSIQAVLAVAFAGVTCYMAVTGRVSGDAFMGLVGLIVAFYFKATQAS